ncbi:MAG TPA: Nif3-like dinuclear metal center hexameric protein [Flavobacteriales bacterium]|nr:Nif3-like dinuclear metal center hexameric protein [Flavobacteriales bacterium]
MKIAEIIKLLEQLAPPAYAEDYDNVGLLMGNAQAEVTGILCTLDCIESVVDEAIKHKCNLIVTHHPIIFKGLKKITGANYVERTVIKAIKNDVAIYAIHTNLDHVTRGVNSIICEQLGLKNTGILKSKSDGLLKLAVFVPHKNVEEVEQAMFKAGAGNIGNYSECDFKVEGVGGYKANEYANPAIGEINKRHTEPETRVEVILPAHAQHTVVAAMIKAHPYEEVAYDLFALKNTSPGVGAGMVGELEKPLGIEEFKGLLKQVFKSGAVRHTRFLGEKIRKIAVCGGSGSFLLKDAIRSGADVYITGDFKYHEFFDAENQIVIVDVGHFESEQYTPQLLADYLKERIQKNSTFAVRLSEVETNPVKYF